jgi:PHD/YefM family antitoxin component YafN of YafNO toxin-antitoxin module
MPTIKSISELINNYNEISKFCHAFSEPVFITKNGKCDLVVMSIEEYEEMTNRFELYNLIKEGFDDIADGNTLPFTDAISSIREKRKS